MYWVRTGLCLDSIRPRPSASVVTAMHVQVVLLVQTHLVIRLHTAHRTPDAPSLPRWSRPHAVPLEAVLDPGSTEARMGGHTNRPSTISA